MNKKLYIRFFDDKDKQIPMDSYPIRGDFKSKLDDWNIHALDWMTNHPNGKIDIVWL